MARQLYLGNARLMEVQGIAYPAIDSTGTVLYLAEDSHFSRLFPYHRPSEGDEHRGLEGFTGGRN